MRDIDELLEENLKDPEFKEAWEETEIEYQIKSMLIAARLENNLIITPPGKTPLIRIKLIKRHNKSMNLILIP